MSKLMIMVPAGPQKWSPIFVKPFEVSAVPREGEFVSAPSHGPGTAQAHFQVSRVEHAFGATPEDHVVVAYCRPVERTEP